ncbi:MAG TPA: outer membrane beta-barrel protein [Flavobacteriales bacterium]|jgi:hypothetical protein|nr:outer membrane beta-barrel protein [Flavobacteriales bacterium]
MPVLLRAQADSTWHWQVKAGPQFVRLSDPIGPFNGPFTGRSVKGLGYLAGIGVGTPIRHGVGWRAEVLFSARNAGYTYDERQGRRPPPTPDKSRLEWGERRSHIRMLEVPVLFAWYRWPGIRLEAGPAIAWLLQANEHAAGTRSEGGTVQDFDELIDRTPAMARVEWAAVLGAEVQGPNGLALSLRYWQGFTDLDAGNGASPSQSVAWQFGVVYAINAKRPALK